MDRDVATRIDGMLMATRGCLNGIAHYMRENLSDDDYCRLIHSIGESMAALIDISTRLHEEHPDIATRELQPDSP